MKIIEAMKQIKEMDRKATDLRAKVAQYSADLDTETPTYGTVEDQRRQVAEWIQSHGDLLKEILARRVAIQRTNLATPVSILIDNVTVTKSIAEWIHRRRDLATLEATMYTGLGQKERHLKEETIIASSGEKKEQKIRRYYVPAERDKKLDVFRGEPMLIDATLEVVNATTDLIESEVPVAATA